MYTLFPKIEPYSIELLRVSPLHRLYLEQSGNPQGRPIIVLHGGPGSHSKPDHRRFYNPKKYRIIIFDQRGCGKSTPNGELRENTSQNLVKDIEKIRKHLDITNWVIKGGSWGSTLALAYAETYPQTVKALILNSILTFRRWEVEWFLKDARIFFPDMWEQGIKTIPPKERNNIGSYLYRLMTGTDTKQQKNVIRAFAPWSLSLLKLFPDLNKATGSIDKKAINAEKILYHYIVNKGFFREGQLIQNANKLKSIPTVIIQGRCDVDCPPITAWELHKNLPGSNIFIISGTGHKSDEPGIAKKIIEHAEKFSNI